MPQPQPICPFSLPPSWLFRACHGRYGPLWRCRRAPVPVTRTSARRSLGYYARSRWLSLLPPPPSVIRLPTRGGAVRGRFASRRCVVAGGGPRRCCAPRVRRPKEGSQPRVGHWGGPRAGATWGGAAAGRDARGRRRTTGVVAAVEQPRGAWLGRRIPAEPRVPSGPERGAGPMSLIGVGGLAVAPGGTPLGGWATVAPEAPSPARASPWRAWSEDPVGGRYWRPTAPRP